MLVIATVIRAMLHTFECVHPISKALIFIMSLHSYSSEQFCMQYWSIVQGFNLFCVSSFMRGHEWNETYPKCFYMAGSFLLKIIICEKLTLSHQPSASPGCDTWAIPQNQLLAIWFFCYLFYILSFIAKSWSSLSVLETA